MGRARTQRENSFLRCQKQLVPVAVRDIPDFAGCLSLVLLKAQRQLAICFDPLRIGFGGGDCGCSVRRDLRESRFTLRSALPCASKNCKEQETANKSGHADELHNL